MLEVNRSSYRYWSGRLKKVPVHRLKLIAKLKRWFDLSLGSAGQRTLVSLLATSDFKVSRWLIRTEIQTRKTQSSLVRRCHLCLDAFGLAVSCCRYRLVRKACSGFRHGQES